MESERLTRWIRGSARGPSWIDMPSLLLLNMDEVEKVEAERRRIRGWAEVRDDRVEELGVEGLMRDGTSVGGEEDRRWVSSRCLERGERE